MDTIAANVATDSGPVSLLDFAEYMRLLRGCYVLALERVKFKESYDHDHADEGDVLLAPLQASAESVASTLLSSNVSMSPHEFDGYIYKTLSVSEDLMLLDIQRRNPIVIVFCAISGALAAAVIVSGGKIKIGTDGINVEVPPLGYGIRRLRNALMKRQGGGD